MPKTAYLTIDDAPSEEFKNKVDLLVSKNIPAIFFCRGDNLEKHSNDLIYAINKGYIIGNHSYNHPHFSKLSNEECFEQIEKTDKIIDSIYKKAGVKRPIKLFRFPYGDKGGGDAFEGGWSRDNKKHINTIQTFLKKLGYKQPKFKAINYKWYKNAGIDNDVDICWTFSTNDWKAYRGIDTIPLIFNRIDENVPEKGLGLNYQKSNDIIILHDHPNSLNLFKKILDKLIEKGMTFKLPEF